MRRGTLLPVLFAALAAGALGFGLGTLVHSEPTKVVAPSASAVLSQAEFDRLEADNERLRDALAAARTRNAKLEAEAAGDGEEIDPAAPAVAAPEEEADRTPEEIAAARAEALRDLESIEYQLTGDPTNPDLLARLVVAAARAGEIDRAIEKLAELAAAHPDNPDVHSQLGRAYVYKIRTVDNQMEQGRYAFSAVGEFDRALEIDPDHFGARLNRGVTNYFMPGFLKKTKDSISDLEKLVEQGGGRGDDDRYAHAYAWLSRAYAKDGREEDAKKTLNEGLRLFPGDPGLLRVSEGR